MFEFGQCDIAFQLTPVPDVNEQPARIVGIAFRVVVFLFPVELCRVRIGFAGNAHEPDDAGLLAIGVVEKYLVTNRHIVTHEVARLVVANTVPGLALVAFQIVDTVVVRLGFH